MAWFAVAVISIIVVQPSHVNPQDNLIGDSDFEKLQIPEYEENRFGLFDSDDLKGDINWSDNDCATAATGAEATVPQDLRNSKFLQLRNEGFKVTTNENPAQENQWLEFSLDCNWSDMSDAVSDNEYMLPVDISQQVNTEKDHLYKLTFLHKTKFDSKDISNPLQIFWNDVRIPFDAVPAYGWQEEALFAQAGGIASKITFLASGTDQLRLDDTAQSKISTGKNSDGFELDLIPQKRDITNEQDAPFLLEINPISLDSSTSMIQLEVVYDQNDFKEISINPDSGIPPFKSVILVHPAQTSGLKNFTILSQDDLGNNVQAVGTVEIQEPKDTLLWNVAIGMLTILLALGLFKAIKR
jgi:hypothetical protein